MYFLWRKNPNDKTGELIVVVTENDRAQRLITGPQWQCINDAINSFNKDPEVKNLYVTAAYAGDLKDEKISECLDRMTVAQAKSAAENNKKQKVQPNGQPVSDENEDNSETKHDKDLKEFLSDYPLICPECGGEGKALVDKDGNILPCKSCLQIDAYIQGKKEGLAQGFDTGVSKAMKQLEHQLDRIDKETKSEESRKESDNGTKEDISDVE